MQRATRRAIAVAIFAAALALAWLAHERWLTFHNETFDLAFYARMAWGMARLEFWDPIVNAHVLGLHLSPVLVPLGWLGVLVGTVPALLLGQAAAVAATAWPLARIGHRRLGEVGALLGACAWLLYPNIGHVATYEFHPGTLAVLPLAWALDSLDRGSVRGLSWSVVGVLACREDLGLITALIGYLAWRGPAVHTARAGKWIAVGSVGWVLAFALVLHPLFAPPHGSMQLHFGRWGDSVPEAAWSMLTDPLGLVAYAFSTEKLLYLARLLAPVAFLPLLKPRLLLPAIPVLAVNLLSAWPTTVELDSHYQTAMLPMLIAASLDGAARVAPRVGRRVAATGTGLALVVAHAAWGGTPLSADFDASAFAADERAEHLPALLAQVPDHASVQAPYAVMPHLAERLQVGPPPPPERLADFVLFDAWHRRAHAHDERLLRTTEEPTVRDWLARADHGVIAARGDYVLLRRGADPRAGLAARYIVGQVPESGEAIARCLSVRGAQIDGRGLVLDLTARGPCPSDLAIRIGLRRRPSRVDLLFDGLLSPVHLREGDRLRSVHPLSAEERAAFERAGVVRIGALRQSGARPEHGDPMSVPIAL